MVAVTRGVGMGGHEMMGHEMMRLINGLRNVLFALGVRLSFSLGVS